MRVEVAGGAEGLVAASAGVLPVGGLVQPLVDPQVVRPGEALAALLAGGAGGRLVGVEVPSEGLQGARPRPAQPTGQRPPLLVHRLHVAGVLQEGALRL